MRLIDADVLIEEFKKWLPKEDSEWLKCGIHPIENLSVSAILTIEEQPIIEAVPVVHGKWVLEERAGIDYWCCSQCHHIRSEYYAKPKDNFCPNCGSDMKSEN